MTFPFQEFTARAVYFGVHEWHDCHGHRTAVEEDGMAGQGRIYRRGQMFFIAYSDRGREFRESTRSRDIEDAKRLLAERLAACQPARAVAVVGVAFVTLCELCLDEYRLRQFRTPDTAGGRVKNLRAFFDHIPANAITTADLRAYQAARHRQNAAAATINRETAALKRMFRLAMAQGHLTAMSLFPTTLPENPPRQGFFEHAESSRCGDTCRRRIKMYSTLRTTQAGGIERSPN